MGRHTLKQQLEKQQEKAQMKNILNNIQKYSLMILLINIFVTQVGRAQVVLPSSSEYNNPENYFHDCVSSNGDEHSGICEQQANSLFQEEKVEQDEYAAAPSEVAEPVEIDTAE